MPNSEANPDWMSHYLTDLGAYLQSLEQSPSAMPPPIPAEAERVPPGVFGALHKAILAHDFTSVITHLKAGENPLLRSPNGMNAFDLACALGNLQVVKLLGGEAAIAKVHETGWVSLMGRQGISLADIPLAYRTPKVCITALAASKNAFEAVPPEYQTPETLAEWSLQQHLVVNALPESIQYAPAFYQRLLPAISLGCWPKPWRDEMIDYALSRCISMFDSLSEDQRTYQRSLAVVREDGRYLSNVPMQHRDEAMCHAAFHKQNSASLADVPELARTYALCLHAMQYSFELNKVPEHYRDEAMCNAAVKEKNCARLHHVPLSLRTYALCLRAMQYSADLDAVPEQHRDEQLLSTLMASLARRRELPALTEDELALLESKSTWGRQVWFLWRRQQAAYRLEYAAFRALPESMRTYDNCLDAVITDVDALPFVPWELRTAELCASALGDREFSQEQYSELIKLFPPDLVEEAYCLAPNKTIGPRVLD